MVRMHCASLGCPELVTLPYTYRHARSIRTVPSARFSRRAAGRWPLPHRQPRRPGTPRAVARIRSPRKQDRELLVGKENHLGGCVSAQPVPITGVGRYVPGPQAALSAPAKKPCLFAAVLAENRSSC